MRLANKLHNCSEPGCGGQKYRYYRTQGSQPLGIEIQSVFCW